MFGWLSSYLVETSEHVVCEEIEECGVIGSDVDGVTNVTVKVLSVGHYGVNCVVISDPVTLDCCIVDPGDDFDVIEEYIVEQKLQVKEIILTHCHFDQMMASGMLSTKYSVRVRANPSEKIMWAFMSMHQQQLGIKMPREIAETMVEPMFDLLEGTLQSVCNLVVIHTPGHTSGSISLYSKSGKFVLTGDLLRFDALGSTTGLGGDPEKTVSSLNKLFSLPMNTRVIPARGPCTMLGRERYQNPDVKKLALR